jgi:chemotaxis regulatin CheY-phosphate phosphatase CheZ
MAMTSNRAHEVLYESEAALRLVDNQLSELRQSPPPEPLHRQPGLADLPGILERANTQILNVLSRLRETRAALQSSAMEKIQATHDKIREVTSATEDAAINIMDACDRASQIVDELDGIDAQPEPDRAKAGELRGTLRDEIFLMMGALQFQDITTQQLNHASAVLVEMEARLLDVAKLFDVNPDFHAITGHAHSAPDAQTYDPNATTHNAEGRQALADEIFTVVRAPAA